MDRVVELWLFFFSLSFFDKKLDDLFFYCGCCCCENVIFFSVFRLLLLLLLQRIGRRRCCCALLAMPRFGSRDWDFFQSIEKEAFSFLMFSRFLFGFFLPLSFSFSLVAIVTVVVDCFFLFSPSGHQRWRWRCRWRCRSSRAISWPSSSQLSCSIFPCFFFLLFSFSLSLPRHNIYLYFRRLTFCLFSFGGKCLLVRRHCRHVMQHSRQLAHPSPMPFLDFSFLFFVSFFLFFVFFVFFVFFAPPVSYLFQRPPSLSLSSSW